MRNEQEALSVKSMILRYETAPKANCEVSAKLCEMANFNFPRSAGLTHLLTAY